LAVRDFSELIFPFFLLGSNSMGPYGENLAATSSGDDPITWGMNAWAEEACEFAILGMDGSKVFFFCAWKVDADIGLCTAAGYDYSSNNPPSGTGHFTQVRT
jgi:hypothetical protein